jgi:putative inorganic carbon (hco3(-)) transporter
MRHDEGGEGRIESAAGTARRPVSQPVLRALRGVAVAVAAAIPLVCWPGLAAPFSTPKLALLAAWVAAGLLAAAAARLPLLAALDSLLFGLVLGWIGLVSISAILAPHVSAEILLLALLPAGAFILQAGLKPRADAVLAAVAAAGAVVASIAILQYAGADPFRWLGWAGPADGSPRLRVFSTLGNPNFVAAFLAAAVPAAWAAGLRIPDWRMRIAGLAAGGLLLAGGILATGSRAPALAALAVAAWAVFRSLKKRYLAILPILFGLLVVGISTARPLADTLEGRLFIWRVTLPHVLESPLVGAGPGSFQLNYPAWETARLAVARSEARFAGFQRHSHNDYLETLVDYGVPGLLLLLAVPALLFGRFCFTRRDSADPAAEGAAAGAVALMALALVDFPLHRPAEAFLFWLFLAIVHSSISIPAAPGPDLRPAEAARRISQGGSV